MENNNRLTNGLIIGEWVTIVGLFVAAFICIQTQIVNQSTALQDQNKRSDKLYEMFIDLVKETKKA